MLAIAGQTTGQNWLKFSYGTHVYPVGNIDLIFFFNQIYLFPNSNFVVAKS